MLHKKHRAFANEVCMIAWAFVECEQCTFIRLESRAITLISDNMQAYCDIVFFAIFNSVRFLCCMHEESPFCECIDLCEKISYSEKRAYK